MVRDLVGLADSARKTASGFRHFHEGAVRILLQTIFLSLTRKCPFGANGNARFAREFKPALEPSPENLKAEIGFSL
jgi:hypothetical protein